MSLNQKYTWNDFLKEHPEHKEKKTKRTSSEGKKAFESAYKAFVKKYLVSRVESIGKGIEKATKRRNELVLKLKETRKSKKFPKAKLLQKKVGRADHAIASLSRQGEKIREKQKSL